MNSVSPESKRIWLLCGVLVFATVLVYLPGLNAPFLFDDRAIEDGEAQLRSPDWSAAQSIGYGRRLTVFASLALNYALGGLDVRGYHVLNLFVHLTAGLSLFGIVRRTLRLPVFEEKFTNSADGFAFAVALLWMVHPLQTQAVTYTIQRCESMMGMFYLLCLYCVLRGSQSARAWPWYVGGMAAAWLGMGCKEVMVTAPLVILLYDRIFLSPNWNAVVRRRWPFYLGLAPAAAWLLFSAASETAPTAGFDCKTVSTWEYLRTQPGVILHYLRLAAFPDRLCLDYRWPVAETWQEILPPTAAIAALVAATGLALRYRPAAGFLGAAFFLILAPTSSIMPIADLAVEHRMYLPLAALTVLGVLAVRIGVAQIARRRSRRGFLVLTLVLVAAMFMVRTATRNALYRSPIAVWANAISVAPQNARAHWSYGAYLAKAGHVDEAIRCYRKTIQLSPDHVDARLDLATALARRGDVDEAIEHFRTALEFNDKIAAAHYNLAVLLERKRDWQNSLAHARRAAAQKPNEPRYHYMLAVALDHCGEHQESAICYKKTLRLDPSNEKARRALAQLATDASRQRRDPL
ncbi:MAG: tetratricopeptide repeat protein [Rhodopirellula sp.]|nr:tetratricopeptide repeat protein [Rhodopirellula sp.]